jgi:hypothetical protein
VALKTWITGYQANPARLSAGLALGVAAFVAIGTVSALWENPFFVRMTPAGEWEVGLLALLAVLTGVYVVVRRPFCSNGAAGAGGVLGFVGIACPVCNKILLLIFGGELLLTYFEPVRIYVAAFGVAIAAWAVVREWRYRHAPPAGQSFSP